MHPLYPSPKVQKNQEDSNSDMQIFLFFIESFSVFFVFCDFLCFRGQLLQTPHSIVVRKKGDFTDSGKGIKNQPAPTVMCEPADVYDRCRCATGKLFDGCHLEVRLCAHYCAFF